MKSPLFSSMHWSLIRLFVFFTVPSVIFLVTVEIITHNYVDIWKKYFPGLWYEVSNGFLMMVGIIVFSLILFHRIGRLTGLLQGEQERLRTIIDYSPDATLVLNGDKLIFLLNSAGEKLLRWREEQLRGKLRCQGVLACHDGEGQNLCETNCPMLMGRQLGGGEVEMAVRNKDGQSVPVKLRVNLLPDRGTMAGAVMLVLQDLSQELVYHQEMKRIAELALDVAALDDSEANLQTALDQIRKVLAADLAVLYLEEGIPQREWLSFKEGLEPTRIRQFWRYGEGLVQRVLTNKTGKVWKVEGHPIREEQIGFVTQRWSLAAVPLILKQQTLGVLMVGMGDNHQYYARDLEFLRRLANQVAIAVENHHLIIERQRHLTEHAEERAVLGERYRLAREIHDGLSQGLGYLKLRTRHVAKCIQGGRTQEAVAELEEFHGIIQELYLDTRDSITNLKVGLTQGGNILDFLSGYLRSFERRTDIQTTLVSPEGLEIRLPSWIELHLVRIIQEALHNVRKHARATEVEVEVTDSDEAWQIRVRDNGQGFIGRHQDVEGTTSFGLTSMKERADEIGALLEITSTSGEGTSIIVTLSKEAEGMRKVVV
ncbi:MAG: GAF domain-containing protein [Clostridia bacterium]|nr:GAF domain-containing protein [Clostridia bacterium]